MSSPRVGRPPNPTKLRLLDGNPGKRALNEKEPQPEGDAECPAWITGKAAEEWARVVAAMPPTLYTSADVAVLAVYCTAWEQYQDALKELADHGSQTAVGSQGQLVPHPALVNAGRLAQQILQAADRLGMTPAARSRLQLKGDAPKSKFGGHLAGSGQQRA